MDSDYRPAPTVGHHWTLIRSAGVVGHALFSRTSAIFVRACRRKRKPTSSARGSDRMHARPYGSALHRDRSWGIRHRIVRLPLLQWRVLFQQRLHYLPGKEVSHFCLFRLRMPSLFPIWPPCRPKTRPCGSV